MAMFEDQYMLRITDPNGEHDTVHVGPYSRRQAQSVARQLEEERVMEFYVEHVYPADRLGDAVYRHKNGVDRAAEF